MYGKSPWNRFFRHWLRLGSFRRHGFLIHSAETHNFLFQSIKYHKYKKKVEWWCCRRHLSRAAKGDLTACQLELSPLSSSTARGLDEVKSRNNFLLWPRIYIVIKADLHTLARAWLPCLQRTLDALLIKNIQHDIKNFSFAIFYNEMKDELKVVKHVGALQASKSG